VESSGGTADIILWLIRIVSVFAWRSASLLAFGARVFGLNRLGTMSGEALVTEAFSTLSISSTEESL
jgi:hypothetical protein